MITVLLCALIFAANQNDIIGWILVVISAAWLLLAVVLVLVIMMGAKKVGAAADATRGAVGAARAAAASRGGGAAVVDEDAHSRNMKLDHSFKIVQVQVRVVQQELAKGEEADMEMVDRALETMEITAHNGRDMLAEHVGRKKKNDDDGNSGETLEGDIVN